MLNKSTRIVRILCMTTKTQPNNTLAYMYVLYLPLKAIFIIETQNTLKLMPSVLHELPYGCIL